MNEKMLEQMIKDVLSNMTSDQPQNESRPVQTKTGSSVSIKDYPISENRPELLRTPSGKTLDEITIESVVDGDVTANDIRISPDTLELQAQVAENAGRDPFAKNLRRAAELTEIPDERILEVYNALRPERSSKEELLEIADELENKYKATVNADFVREAAEVYEQRKILRVD